LNRRIYDKTVTYVKAGPQTCNLWVARSLGTHYLQPAMA